MCAECERLYQKIREANTRKEKEQAQEEYQRHLQEAHPDLYKKYGH